ncbi:MAG: hypothetical protein LBR43_01040 [Spiroplasmataceae bacterium]|jgi:hypothetical protein|nr:hypothetical protein [Spiroplasmataceae bacterium]
MNALRISERVGNKFLNELVELERNSQEQSDRRLECLIKDKVEFEYKFELGVDSFYQLIFNEINDKVSILKNKLCVVENKLQHQKKIVCSCSSSPTRQNLVRMSI